jgi:hypothetical protein
MIGGWPQLPDIVEKLILGQANRFVAPLLRPTRAAGKPNAGMAQD